MYTSTVYALIFIIFSSLSTNLITNYVPTQNSIINFLPKNLDLKSAGILILIFGLITGRFVAIIIKPNRNNKIN